MNGCGWGYDAGAQFPRDLPGDPDRVLAAVTEFSVTATSLGEAASSLRRLESPDTSSEAVSACLVKARQVAAQLELVKIRYDEASEALREYEPHLRQAQQDARAAAHDADAAWAERNQAIATAHGYREAIRSAVDENQRSDYLVEYRREQARRDQAVADVSAARFRLQQAIDARNDAANRAADRIEAVVRNSLLNDTFGDKFKAIADPIAKWLHESGILEQIANVLNTISVVLFVAAVVLSFTGFGAPIAAGLFTASRVVGGVALGVDVLDGVVKGYVTGNWSSLGVTVAAAVAAKAASKYLGPAVGKKVRHGAGKYNAAISQLASRDTGAVMRSTGRTPPVPGVGGTAVRAAGTGVPRNVSGSVARSLQDVQRRGASRFVDKLLVRVPTHELAQEIGEGMVEEVVEDASRDVLRCARAHYVARQPVGAAQ